MAPGTYKDYSKSCKFLRSGNCWLLEGIYLRWEEGDWLKLAEDRVIKPDHQMRSDKDS
jgi:hypothetical protein